MHPVRLNRVPGTLLLGLLLMSALASGAAHAATPAPAQPESRSQGTPFVGQAGIQVRNVDITASQVSHAGDPLAGPNARNEFELERDGLRANPASPRIGSIPVMPPDKMVYHPVDKLGRSFQVFSPQTVGPNFTAATLAGTNPTNAFPPDCDGAVGPTQYIVAVNGRIVSFNKTTGAADGAMSYSTDNFFNSVRAGSGTSDPQIRYDRLSGRWFVGIINVSTPNRFLLAVSDAASNGTITPGTVWTFFWFNPSTISPSIGNCLSDYPSLGVDANAVYMGVDEFCPSTFQQTDAFVIRKTSVLGAGPIVVTPFRELMSAGTGFVGPWAPRGVDNPNPGTNEGYFVGVDGNSYGTLQLRRVSDPGGTPAISGNVTVTLPLTDAPLNVPHLGNTGGTNGNVDALDDRIFYAGMRNGQLWISQNIAVDNTGVVNGTAANNTRDGSRWYQIDVPPGAGAPTIVQSGTVFTQTANNLTTERHYFVPSIAVSGQGHAAMGFSTAGTNERINAASVGRLANDPPGTMETPVLLTASATAYNPTGDTGAGRGRRRWGDYSVTTVDPIDDMSMWTVQMFCDATNSYGVRAAKLVAPGPATPNVLSDVAAGYPTVSVTLSGSSALGSGFFDPGANLPGVPAYAHLSAAITNGAATGTPPSVVSATYVNPTTVNLVLNTSSATPNLAGEKYTITITNPDGQTSSAAIVHVVSGTTYTINATAGTGGAIVPSGAVTVLSGNNQSFSITAAPCYTIADVLVDGVSVGPVASYTFTNVTSNHTIDASFTLLGPYTITATAGANGSIAPNGATSVNCGDNLTYTISPDACYHVASVLVDGSPVGAVTSYTFSNVQSNHTIDASFAANPAVGPVTGLTATPDHAVGDASGRTTVGLTFTAPAGATVEVYRKEFGGYPTYAGGSAPAAPGSYPPAGWALTGVTASGQSDQPPARDFWYYVAYAKDACNTVSVASNVTGGTLDYQLGDVSDGTTPGNGDNRASLLDISLLGAHYGDSGPAVAGFEYLDFGPTTDNTVDARPTPDTKIDFEDLVLAAINFTPSLPVAQRAGVTPRGSNQLTLKSPIAVAPGDEIDVPVTLSGAGDLQALSVTLGWNAQVVTPIAVTAGDLVTVNGGTVLSPGPGRFDAALLGAGHTFSGVGTLATVRFKAIAAGDPALAFTKTTGRNPLNHAVIVGTINPLAMGGAVAATELAPPVPNPSSGTSVMQYSLARAGAVDLAVFGLDGGRVKTIAHGVQGVGRYQVTWNGSDEHGAPVRSGLYFVRLSAPSLNKTRLLTVIR